MDVLARGNNTATQRKMPTVIAKKHNALFLFLFGAIRHPKQRDSTETKTPEQKAKSMSGTTMSAITTAFKRSKTLTGRRCLLFTQNFTLVAKTATQNCANDLNKSLTENQAHNWLCNAPAPQPREQQLTAPDC